MADRSDPPSDAPITINILTGFLGSGKTLLLKRLLSLPNLAGTAVLINEFGDVGLDHLLLEAVDDDVVLLQSGCICCTIRGDLKDAIINLHHRMRLGELPVFDRLVIETTGLADPAPIVATFTADPVLRYHFRLGNIVTVVDAVNGQITLDTYVEAAHQAAVADRLVISKTDMAEAKAVSALRDKLNTLNPTADMMLSTADASIPEALLSHDVHDGSAKEAEVARWLAVEHHHHHHHETGLPDRNRHGDIRAFCVTADEPLDWAVFGMWLSMLLNRHGSEILRVKGLLNIVDIDAPVVVHGVQHMVQQPEHLSAWPDGDSRSRIVFIAKDLDPTQVERSFQAFMGLSGGRRCI